MRDLGLCATSAGSMAHATRLGLDLSRLDPQGKGAGLLHPGRRPHHVPDPQPRDPGRVGILLRNYTEFIVGSAASFIRGSTSAA